MSLHTLNKAPQHSSAFSDCLNALQDGDALLLIEDGVYAALNAYANQFNNRQISCYVLRPDADARGIKDLNPAFQATDYAGFVELCCQHSPVVSWS